MISRIILEEAGWEFTPDDKAASEDVEVYYIQDVYDESYRLTKSNPGHIKIVHKRSVSDSDVLFKGTIDSWKELDSLMGMVGIIR